MPSGGGRVDVYLETGTKRVFAGALDWPGWCRGGRDEDSALESLLHYGPRYARALRGTRLGFTAPTELRVTERIEGGATTDFGAPEASPSSDSKRVSEAELRRLRSVMRACWRVFDAAVDAARGKTLSTGPRGGGRKLAAIVDHVRDAEESYLRSIAWKIARGEEHDRDGKLDRVRRGALDALDSAVRNGLPERGPRGGRLWTPRYFVRRAAWHVLDHAWEIEDRAG